MTEALSFLHWSAGVVVLAEALNKLERTAPCARGLSRHDRLVEILKAVAWVLLAMGAGGTVVTPGLAVLGAPSHQTPWLRDLSDMAVMLGFAVLIVRTRVKEG